ncbi:hypothetical protein D3C76_1631670 [compost metagenome]
MDVFPMIETDILYEDGNYWIAKDKIGNFIIYKNTITHSEGIHSVSPEPDPEKEGSYGLQLAIELIEWLSSKDKQ